MFPFAIHPALAVVVTWQRRAGVVAPYGINAAYRNRPAVYLPPSPVFHFSFPPKFFLDILPPTVYKCTNTINTLYRGTKNQPKKEAER